MNQRSNLATSRDPTPRKDSNEDGNYIIENFTDRHEPSDLRFPSILNFIERPTLKNAKAILSDYKIHQPLASYMRSRKNKYANKLEKSSSPPHKGGIPTTIQYELLILDTMHDLLETEPQTMYNIFKKEIDLPAHLKTSFLRSDYSFTRDAASYIQQKAKIPIQNTAFDNKTRKAYDHALVASISSWTSLNFVLDNFAVNVQNGGGGPQSQSVMTLLGCAYLIVLLSNMKHLNLIPRQCQHITVIDGFFMHLDGSYISRFAVLFTKTLYRLTHLDTFIKPNIFKTPITKPKYFNKMFPEAQAIISKTRILINSTSYDIFPPNPLPNQVYYPHTKQIFFQHVKAQPKNKDFWYLNFLRDAFKADVALETDSVFVTHDKLAFTYYKLIGDKHGFLISLDTSIDQNQVQQCEYLVSF